MRLLFTLVLLIFGLLNSFADEVTTSSVDEAPQLTQQSSEHTDSASFADEVTTSSVDETPQLSQQSSEHTGNATITTEGGQLEIDASRAVASATESEQPDKKEIATSSTFGFENIKPLLTFVLDHILLILGTLYISAFILIKWIGKLIEKKISSSSVNAAPENRIRFSDYKGSTIGNVLFALLAPLGWGFIIFHCMIFGGLAAVELLPKFRD